jgi:D-psicose/D-tagatose/L-ribulose 3-epimerase
LGREVWRGSQASDFAANLGVNLCLEVLNRFENHVLNTAEEGVAFVRRSRKPTSRLGSIRSI